MANNFEIIQPTYKPFIWHFGLCSCDLIFSIILWIWAKVQGLVLGSKRPKQNCHLLVKRFPHKFYIISKQNQWKKRLCRWSRYKLVITNLSLIYTNLEGIDILPLLLKLTYNFLMCQTLDALSLALISLTMTSRKYGIQPDLGSLAVSKTISWMIIVKT